MKLRANIAIVTAFALAAQPVIASAQSASERGPGKFQTGSGGPTATGVGAELRLTIPLGGGKASDVQSRGRVDLNAGPLLVQSGNASQNVVRRSQGGLVNLRLTPGHSTRFSIAGQSVAASYGPLAADEEREGEEKDGGGPSTLGWIGIGVGASFAALLVAGAIVFADYCSECDQ